MNLHTGNTQVATRSSRRPVPKSKLYRAIREKCLECSGTPNEVGACDCEDCHLWSIRLAPKTRTAKVDPTGKMVAELHKLRLLKTIRAECLACLGGADPGSVCTSPGCPLYPFRRGPHSVKGADQ
jgi:hypothetical protein